MENIKPVKLFLDDKLTPHSEDWAVVRSFDEAKTYVLENGVPRIVSFGYDLGSDEEQKPLPSGYDFAKWLVESDMSGDIALPSNFVYKVHAQDTVQAEKISTTLRDYLDFKFDGFSI